MNEQPTALRLADEIWPWREGVTNNLSLAAAELRRLSEENEALRADAERYRWLRNNAMIEFVVSSNAVSVSVFTYYSDDQEHDKLNAAIDAARSKA